MGYAPRRFHLFYFHGKRSRTRTRAIAAVASSRNASPICKYGSFSDRLLSACSLARISRLVLVSPWKTSSSANPLSNERLCTCPCCGQCTRWGIAQMIPVIVVSGTERRNGGGHPGRLSAATRGIYQTMKQAITRHQMAPRELYVMGI